MTAASFVLVLVLGLLPDQCSIVSHAQSQGKVTASSAKIRKEADGNSEVIGSASQNASVTINNQVTAGDNTVWYQVFVDADTLGYIRSDLVQITDGTTPPAGTSTVASAGTSSTTTTTPAADPPAVNPPTTETPVEVTAVEPVSASVTGGQEVRVRANASTTSEIITTAKSGFALTVTGQANGTDGNLWYQVTFIADGRDVTGFIRSDYVQLSGELVPAGAEDPGTGDIPQEPETPQTPEVTKDWDTHYDAEKGKWYLDDIVGEKKYQIDQLFELANSYQTLFDSSAKDQSKIKTQTIVIIVLVVLLIGMAGFITVLIFKIKDMMDSTYFSEVEKETIQRRGGARSAGVGQKVMHDVGAAKKQGGQRSAGTAARGGPRPAGAPAQGGPRPTGTRPAGAPVSGNQRSSETKQSALGGGNTQNPGWKSKNFMTEDDEFEFEFLNWDGEEDK